MRREIAGREVPKTKAQRFLARPLRLLVGRVGIEPTTNGLTTRRLIEQQAPSGSLRAGLSLARMYTTGLGVAQGRVRGYAWLRWGQQYGSWDNDPTPVRTSTSYGLSTFPT